jgi:hypothetical protein
MSQPVWIAGVAGKHLVRELRREYEKKKKRDEERGKYECPH